MLGLVTGIACGLLSGTSECPSDSPFFYPVDIGLALWMFGVPIWTVATLFARYQRSQQAAP